MPVIICVVRQVRVCWIVLESGLHRSGFNGLLPHMLDINILKCAQTHYLLYSHVLGQLDSVHTTGLVQGRCIFRSQPRSHLRF